MIPVLYYHRIGHFQNGITKLAVEPENFEKQVSWLRKMGFASITCEKLARIIRGEEKKKGRMVCLTFDDGYMDSYTYGLPILEKYGFTATFFVVTDFVGRRDEFNSVPGLPHVDLMTWPQIIDLHKKGMEIGSHSATHRVLKNLDLDSLEREIVVSKRTIEAAIAAPVSSFAYPKGKFDEATRQTVMKAGYTIALATKSGLRQKKENILGIRRIRISGKDSIISFARKILKMSLIG
jgi:peptidoglycan/xylan/chitin deacetylase (PgdA/CDA1 family)